MNKKVYLIILLSLISLTGCNFGCSVNNTSGNNSQNTTLDNNSVVIYVGDTITLKCNSNKWVKWSSSDSKIASVSSKGKVEGKGVGTAIITAKTLFGATASCTIQVNRDTIYLKYDRAEIFVGDVFILMWKAHRPVTWYSSDDSVATVYNGKVEGKSVGEATIFAKSSTRGSASCTVIVHKRNLS